MHALDWTVIGLYLVGVLGLGLSLARRAGQSSESYLVAGRRLRWWVIGTSDVASDAGGDAYWILVIFTAAFMGMYRVWWISSAVALPLAIIWARYWRRLALLSPWEIFEVRRARLNLHASGTCRLEASGRERVLIVILHPKRHAAFLLFPEGGDCRVALPAAKPAHDRISRTEATAQGIKYSVAN